MSVIGQLNASCKHFQIHTELIWDIQSMITYIPPEGLALFLKYPDLYLYLTHAVIETKANHQNLDRHPQLMPMCIALHFNQCPAI